MNERFALLSRGDVEHVLSKHVASSLGALLLVTPSDREQWVDVGTGAGLPGLVLKAWCPSQSITLIDGSRKKCVFLENMVRVLGVGEVPVLCVRVETLVAREELLEGFDVLFARAVADLGTCLREFGPLLRPGGRFVTFKGPGWAQELELARRTGELLAFGRHVETVVLPWAPAHLLLLEKRS